MTISQQMMQRSSVGRWLLLSSVAVLAFMSGTVFGAFARDSLPLGASQQQAAPLAMISAGDMASSPWELYRCDGCPGVAGSVPQAAPRTMISAGDTASSPWELYRCDGCPGVSEVVRYFTGATPSQGPWDLYQCDGCTDAAGVSHYYGRVRAVK